MADTTASSSVPREQRCETCAAWDSEKGKKGFCRRLPPATALEMRPWFKTKPDDWCLEWVKKEK